MRLPLAAVSLGRATRSLFGSGCVALSIVAASIACSPTFNWREFRSPEGIAVMLPGRPQTVSREVNLPDGTALMSMTSTGIGATLFAVGTAQLPAGFSAEPEARQRTIAHLRDALVHNIGGSMVKQSSAVLSVPAGDFRKVLAAEAVEASGREAGGRPVQLAARLFIVDDRLFQVVALGAKDEMSPEALDIFFASFRLI